MSKKELVCRVSEEGVPVDFHSLLFRPLCHYPKIKRKLNLAVKIMKN